MRVAGCGLGIAECGWGGAELRQIGEETRVEPRAKETPEGWCLIAWSDQRHSADETRARRLREKRWQEKRARQKLATSHSRNLELRSWNLELRTRTQNFGSEPGPSLLSSQFSVLSSQSSVLSLLSFRGPHRALVFALRDALHALVEEALQAASVVGFGRVDVALSGFGIRDWRIRD